MTTASAFTKRKSSPIKAVCGLTAAAALMLAPAIPAAADNGEDDFTVPLAAFDFDDPESGFAGAGAVATPKGDLELVSDDAGGQAVKFDNNFWLDVTKENGSPLLDGINDVQISYEAKPSSKEGGQSWTIFASPNAAEQNYAHERYLGILDTTQGLTVERYANDGSGRDSSGNLSADYTNEAWKHVELDITGQSATLRIDGVEVDTNSAGKDLAELAGGSNSIFQIGKANWSSNGEYFNGLIRNVEISTTPQSAIAQALSQLQVPQYTTDDIDLPATGANGAEFSWESSNPSVIDTGGRVTPGPEDETVELTVTAELGGITETREFSVIVAAGIDDVESAAEALLLPYVLSSGDQLPSDIPGAAQASVDWEATNADVVDASGTILGAAGSDPVEVDFTATVTIENQVASKYFEAVIVMPQTASTLASYTRDATIDGGLRVGNSMHLGLSTDGEEFVGLNQNYGVAFAEAEIITNEDDKTQTTSIRGLTDPFLFRKSDGNHAFVAVLTTQGGERVNPGQILFSESEDLTQWSGKPNEDEIGGLVTVSNAGEHFDAGSLTAGWDSAAGNYRIAWEIAGVPQFVTTMDFENFSDVAYGPGFVNTSASNLGIPNAVPSNSITIEPDLADYVSMKLGRVTNVDLDNPEDITVAAGTELEDVIERIEGGQELENGMLSKGATSTAHYSDGSTFDFRVDWDAQNLADIDTASPGEYPVRGQIIQQNFADQYPVMENRADPNIVYWDGKYYAMGTSDRGGMEVLFIRSADSLAGLKDKSGGHHDQGGWMVPGQDQLLLGPNDGFGHKGYHWAPEMHVVTDSNGDDNLYIFYAANPADNNDGSGVPYEGPNWMGPAAYVLELKPGADPMETSSWIEHRALNQDGDHLSDTGLTIDMTYFVVNGQSYLAWSQGNETYAGAKADVTIATTDPDKPWQITSDPVRIIRPEWGWELDGVSEGANVLLNDGKVYMVFSGQMVGPQYATGMMIADQDADLLDPAAWTKSNYPWLHNGVFEGQYGLGHNSYFKDPYGDAFNVYHAIASKDGGERHAGIVPIHYRADGSPVLDMKPNEELLPEFANSEITINVIVEEDSNGGGEDPETPEPEPEPSEPEPSQPSTDPETPQTPEPTPDATADPEDPADDQGAGDAGEESEEGGILPVTGAQFLIGTLALALLLLANGVWIIRLKRERSS